MSILPPLKVDGMSEEARVALYENAPHVINAYGKEPCELLEELEQLAAEEGYTDTHSFINSFLQFGDQS